MVDRALTAIATGRIKRLIVEMPPRHGKSELISRYFPAWYLGTFPDRKVILCSYGDDLASNFGLAARRVIEEHGPTYFGVSVSADRASRNDWGIAGHDGGMVSAGVGGPITGKGADLLIVDDYCIARGQRILTRRGQIPIERVVVGDLVFTHQRRWRPVTAVHSNGVKGIVRVNVDGREMIATPDHLVYTSRGWTKVQIAKDIYGIDLRTMRQCVPRCVDSSAILFAQMHGRRATFASQELQAMQRHVSAAKRNRAKVLLGDLREKGAIKSSGDNLSRLPCGVPYEQDGAKVLQCEMSSKGLARKGKGQTRFLGNCDREGEENQEWRNERQEQPKLSSRPVCKMVQQGVPGEDQQGDHSAGRTMPRVQLEACADLPSFGRNKNKQCEEQPGNALQFVSYQVSQIEECGVEEVFDLTVAEDHSYVVEGFVVHNCKNSEEAISESWRRKTAAWWKSTAYTRVEPAGAIVVMATRWHKQDLIGELLAGEEKWHRIKLPAIAEAGDQMGREIGDALWPERWPIKLLEGRKRSIGAAWWSSMYQQNPTIHEGAEWPAEYFRDSIWADPWPDAFENSAMACDPSKGRGQGDYSAIVFVGQCGGRWYVDSSIMRRPVERIVRDFLAMYARHRPAVVGCEANAFQELLATEIQRQITASNLPPVKIEKMNNQVNKHLRISRLGPYLEQGLLRFRDNESCRLLVQQMQEFPLADHDDGPDAMEMAMRLTAANQFVEYDDSDFETYERVRW